MCADASEEPAAFNIKKTTRRHTQGYGNLHKHGREKLKTFLEVSSLNKHQALLVIKLGKIKHAITLPEE